MKFPEEFRVLTHPSFGTRKGEPFGAFLIGGRYALGRTLQVIACDGLETGWEHVSVSMTDNKRKTPSWEEMAFVKSLFWDAEEAVIQFHPPASEYVNNHEGCLHLWRCVESMIGHFPLPPADLVGWKRKVAA